MQTSIPRQVTSVILFSIAMAYLEAVVVVYLRDIYYPGGFQFPLTPIPVKTFFVELLREAATLVMLVCIGLLAGRTKYQRFAFFLMAFGVWDIFYYVFLKIVLGWPASLATWDILFLIPVPWVGPVWAPCLLALTMVFLGGLIIFQERNTKTYALPFKQLLFLIVGSLVVILSFCLDPWRHLQQFTTAGLTGYVPKTFDWLMFLVGELLIIIGMIRLYRFNKEC